MADEPQIIYRYVGPDTFPGIPATDLTQEALDRLPILRQLDVKASASYELVEPKQSQKAEKPVANKEGAKP